MFSNPLIAIALGALFGGLLVSGGNDPTPPFSESDENFVDAEPGSDEAIKKHTD